MRIFLLYCHSLLKFRCRNSFYVLNNEKPNILKDHLETYVPIFFIVALFAHRLLSAAKGVLKAEAQEKKAQEKQGQAALELPRAAQYVAQGLLLSAHY